MPTRRAGEKKAPAPQLSEGLLWRQEQEEIAAPAHERRFFQHWRHWLGREALTDPSSVLRPANCRVRKHPDPQLDKSRAASQGGRTPPARRARATGRISNDWGPFCPVTSIRLLRSTASCAQLQTAETSHVALLQRFQKIKNSFASRELGNWFTAKSLVAQAWDA